ncbi:MBL fold metallo-hydrolase [Vibrio vulnificus]|uniref:MBL fold metallo-hydrolase n=1 Tax=Vibrio vulnificus TaxID=672 RepID=UPI0001F5C2B9|nr:MBL fold metallo-hydrolase [Vibrio vulnificus]ADV85755.1 metal-dependent hydrolase [Vibrio vulnificus MO6-24/O]EGR0036778.1 MBL fold metallo-hydrolase [Vibrio vulnificus]EGR0089753.1 MBL fold metallo-hydrolase [Vibrio vulnificus]EGR0096074.1 MBL fold metallo-hydrolase [Vibrio vulnificus]EGR0107951.1 MBL fold metallo-hydrolase [Vibrio vulnificus]
MQTGLKIKIFEAGHCVHPSFVVKPGSGLKPRSFPAAVALIQHPTKGNILFDTGYHEHFFRATRPFPERFYAWTTPCHYQKERGIVAQLAKEKIGPHEIEHLVLSHFHADHIAAVSEFAHSQLHCQQKGVDALTKGGRVGGVRKGYLKALLPQQLESNLVMHRDFSIPIGEILPHCQGVDLLCKDMFNDGLIYMVSLPGHAAGQVGLLVKREQGWLFLLADACWLIENLSENIDQHWLANLLCDDTQAYKQTLSELRNCYQHTHHFVRFVPSHCQATIQQLITEGWIM